MLGFLCDGARLSLPLPLSIPASFLELGTILVRTLTNSDQEQTPIPKLTARIAESPSKEHLMNHETTTRLMNYYHPESPKPKPLKPWKVHLSLKETLPNHQNPYSALL